MANWSASAFSIASKLNAAIIRRPYLHDDCDSLLSRPFVSEVRSRIRDIYMQQQELQQQQQHSRGESGDAYDAGNAATHKAARVLTMVDTCLTRERVSALADILGAVSCHPSIYTILGCVESAMNDGSRVDALADALAPLLVHAPEEHLAALDGLMVAGPIGQALDRLPAYTSMYATEVGSVLDVYEAWIERDAEQAVDATIAGVAMCVRSQMLQKGLLLAIALFGRANIISAGNVGPAVVLLGLTPLPLVAAAAAVASTVLKMHESSKRDQAACAQ